MNALLLGINVLIYRKNGKNSDKKTGYDGKKLQVTGDLLTSLNLDYGKNFAMIRASEHYAQYHQVGTKYMPARQFLGISNNGIKEIKAILHRTLKQTIQD